jgi:hypothetical protein
MMRRLKPLYPFLFVVLPILNVLTRNPGGSTLADSVAVMGAMLLGLALLYGAAALALQGRIEKGVLPLAMLAAILWFYAYQLLRRAYHFSHGSSLRVAATALALAALAAATVALVWWLGRRPRLLERVNTFFALTGLLLVSFSVVRIVGHQLQARSRLARSGLARELARPIKLNQASVANDGEPSRDIYLIILDEYANSDVLRERFGFDNRVFEDSLRKLGFTIPRLVRSNYVHTLLSLPSLLNFSHLTRLGAEVGGHATDPTVANHLVENNRTAAFLKSRGYRFVFYPSQWWISTEHNRNADLEVQVWDGFDLAREASRSDMRRAFLGTTPFALLSRGDPHDADHVKRTLEALGEAPAASGPTFALSHILNPHYPYVFDAACRTYRSRPNRSWGRGRQKDYLAQVECLNQLLLGTVTRLLRHSSPAPIILLVGDHGTNSLGYSDAESAEAVTPAQARERFGAFGAFYLPGSGDRILPDSVTLVNLIPRVLNHYFGAGIELVPDSLYMSLEKTPYLLAPVDPASLSPGR